MKLKLSFLIVVLVAASLPNFSLASNIRVGQLVYNPGSRTVYLVDSNVLHGFPSADIFYSWGFKFSQIVKANSEELALGQGDLVPTKAADCGVPLDQIKGNCGQAASTTPRGGQLVFIPGSRTVYLVGNSGLYGFESAAIFYSWGYTFSQIVRANKGEQALTMVGHVPVKQVGCSTPFNQINGTCGTTAVSVGIATADTLTLTQNIYGKISFNASPLTTLTATPLNYTFSETGSVPGMVFSGYPCHNPAMGMMCPATISVTAVFLDGVSTAVGTFPVTITARDQYGNSASQNFTIIVNSVANTNNSITILSPAGGEQWAMGSTQAVRWSAPSSLGALSITISQYVNCLNNKISCAMLQPAPYQIAGNIPNTGSFSWTIGATSLDGRTIPAGQYTLTITTADGSVSGSSAAPFTITSAVSLVPVINSLSPVSGAIGTLVTVKGLNFTADSIINFGSGNADITFIDANTLQFTVPENLYSGCKPPMMCPTYITDVKPGSYNVSVTNSNGTSNIQTFLVN